MRSNDQTIVKFVICNWFVVDYHQPVSA